MTKTGTTFDHEIPVAVPTPEAQSNQLVPQAILGAFVGILPVAIGLMFYPVLRGVGRQAWLSSRPYHRASRVSVCRLAR